MSIPIMKLVCIWYHGLCVRVRVGKLEVKGFHQNFLEPFGPLWQCFQAGTHLIYMYLIS